MSKQVLTAIAAVSLLMPAAVEAQPIQWGGNGHFYEFVAAPGIHWNVAHTAAAAREHNGIPGHLLTITNSNENDFILDTFFDGTATFGWIGASDSAAEGQWLWVDGPETGTQFWQGDANGNTTPPFNFANWGPQDPNAGGENWALFALGVFMDVQPGEWGTDNDGGGSTPVVGYFVEYSKPCPIADIINVPGDFSTIQAAIANSSDCDEIVVAPGTYNEVIDFLGKAITLRSSDGADVTTIDGTGLNDSVVKCVSGERVDTVLEGFTITGGSATLGGGMKNGIKGLPSHPTVNDCVFVGNHATEEGGGMWNRHGSNPTVTNCTFEDNSSAKGGGMYNEDSMPTISDCLFTNNEASLSGGGLFNGQSSSTVTNCLFINNTANLGGAILDGASCCGEHSTFANCTMTSNSATHADGVGGGGMRATTSDTVITNCIIWNNEGGSMSLDGANPSVTYSDIEGGYLGDGNIDADPLFVDPDNGDYRLGSCSPAVDAGDNDAVSPEFTTDLDGNPRFVDDSGKVDTGNGTPPIVDMGAFERQDDTASTIHIVMPGQSIQAAIDAAADCDEIVVQPGTYNEVINFLGKAITLRSSGGADVTTIDGTDLNNSVVKCVSGEGVDTVLEGFTITGGNATLGGGMKNGIKGLPSHPTVNDCVFVGNHATEEGGGMWNRHGSNPTVTNCTFEDNTSDIWGGGMYNEDSSPTVSNCAFIGNNAFRGGGLRNHQSSPIITNCLFANNTAGRGAAVANLQQCCGSVATFINCTITSNQATDFGGGMREEGSDTIITNCIIWNNEGGSISLDGANPSVTYSDIEGGFLGKGNIDTDPLFVDPDNGDFHIAFDSPCIDVGDNSVVESDAVDIDGEERIQHGIVDMGADEFTFCIADINGDGVVDPVDLAMLLGAWGPCPELPASCPADIHGDGDGIVQADDLATLLANWGPCP